MIDVLIAGAGPAGSVAALVLARAGARVLIVDRETFPRDKLCGDSVNPGALAFIDSLGLRGGPLDRAHPLRGMLVTTARVGARFNYATGISGRGVTRRDLDSWLLEQAIAAGARFESGLVARGALTDDRHSQPLVRGLELRQRRSGRVVRLPASMTIAADGRQSAIARSLGLVGGHRSPRRWAFGAYARGVFGVADAGEMHIRPAYYVGIAPLAPDRANICLVTGPRPLGGLPIGILRAAIDADRDLSTRFEHAIFEEPVRVLGPLAADRRATGVPGLFLAGDAAGFVDPLTGDGVNLAMRGGALAAYEALRTLESGDAFGATARLTRSRHVAMGAKLRFNRVARAIVDSPATVDAISWIARVTETPIQWMVNYAGDAR